MAAHDTSRARVLSLKTEENKKNSSCSLPLQETEGVQDIRARAQACYDSGLLDDWKLRPVVTILTQRRPASQGQIEALEECEAFVRLMREAQQRRQEQAEEAAKPAKPTLAARRGHWSKEAMQERLAAYQRVQADRGGPGADPALDERVNALAKRLDRK